MNRDLLNGAARRVALFPAAKIERAPYPQAAQHRNVGLGQMAEMIGTEDLPPAHRASVLAGIAAEVPEIVGPGEIEMTDKKFLHGNTLSEVLR